MTYMQLMLPASVTCDGSALTILTTGGTGKNPKSNLHH